MVYIIARRGLKIVALCWLVLFIPLFVTLAQIVAQLPRKGFPDNLYDTVLGTFFLPGRNLILTLGFFGLLLVLLLVFRLLSSLENHTRGDKFLRKYLQAIVDANQGLSPRGLAQQSQALISVNVPLDEIFIHLHAVADRPIYDMPGEQKKILEEIRLRSDLTIEEREELIQRMRVIWYSELGQESSGTHQQQSTSIGKVLQLLNLENPVAVILGAPGSGKSTVMRWLALQMAQATLSPKYHLPIILSPKQVPVLLRISDYAKRLSTENISFKQFFKEYMHVAYPDQLQIHARLLEELDAGHCLVLFDGLDEVASDHLRRQVADNIYQFISGYLPKGPKKQQHNRFIVTSRIVGYEAGRFAKYAHYTLSDLEEKQIERFLMNWCPAVERYQTMFAQGMKPPTREQKERIKIAGVEQKDRLLEALQNNTGMKRLAANPLMLTILALIQRSGRTLPQRRIELYQTVTRTLLDNWNQDTGRKIFPNEELSLAEQLLSLLAYRLHSSDPVLTTQDIKEIVVEPMAKFYQSSPEEISDQSIQQFVATLRSSSGLFVESGQGLFNFMHRTFQEYFVALYLLSLPSETLKDFVTQHFTKAIWREPLLLAIAYKSGQSSTLEKKEASELIRAVLMRQDEYEAILNRSLLFGAVALVDCNVWSIDKAVQYDIANRLFKLYGDYFGVGRYKKLVVEIEKIILLWLRSQPTEINLQDTWSPLLEVWRIALSDSTHAMRQEGAVHLLKEFVFEISNCPKSVKFALIPPLIQLAQMQKLPCHPKVQMQFPLPEAHAATQEIMECAFIILRLLDVHGPASWLYTEWIDWCNDHSEALKSLSLHSLEIDHLFTPAAFPGEKNNTNWNTQFQIFYEWKKLGQKSPDKLHLRLLQASNTARYPFAYILMRLLENELRLSTSGQSWYSLWDTFLKEEMSDAEGIVYQLYLSFRVDLCQNDEQKLQKLVDDLLESLSMQDQKKEHILATVAMLRSVPYQDSISFNDNTFNSKRARYLESKEELQYECIKLMMRDELDLSTNQIVKEVRNKKDLQDFVEMYLVAVKLANLIDTDFDDPSELYDIPVFKNMTEFIEMLELFYKLDEMDASKLQYTKAIITSVPKLIKIKYLYYLKYLPLFRIQFICWIKRDKKYPELSSRIDALIDKLSIEKENRMIYEGKDWNLFKLAKKIDVVQLVQILCKLLQKNEDDLLCTMILSALYKLIMTNDFEASSSYNEIHENILESLPTQKILTGEQQFLTEIIIEHLKKDSSMSKLQKFKLSPNDEAAALVALREEKHLTGLQLEKILAGCSDIRMLSAFQFKSQIGDYYYNIDTVSEAAQMLLTQQFILGEDAFSILIDALDNPSRRAYAAKLLGSNKRLPERIVKEARQKIKHLLQESLASQRILEMTYMLNGPREDDVLFEALEALVE